jgi:hypothetical protein
VERAPDADITPGGACTVQCVIRIHNGLPGGSLDPQFFSLQKKNTNYLSTNWSLGLEHTTGEATMIPRFFYRNAADSASILLEATGFSLVQGVYHLVGRRISDGASGYDVSIWVNGMKVAELESQVAAYTGGSSQQVKVKGAGAGSVDFHLDSCKMSNIALTDAQIISEYKKALGIV